MTCAPVRVAPRGGPCLSPHLRAGSYARPAAAFGVAAAWMARRWRPEDDGHRSGWYVEGVPVIEIGRRLERSPDAVDARPRALGLAARRRRPPRRRWSPKQYALLRASARAGLPARC